MAGFVRCSTSWRIDAPCARVRVRVAVALTDDAVGRIRQVAAACRALGFEHDSTLRSVGILTGSAALEHLPVIRHVPGVLAVEPERQWYLRAR